MVVIMSDKIGYYQTIPELGIKGRMDTPKEFDLIGLPKDLNHYSILDIGCNTGAFLVEAHKRGAIYVCGVEHDLDWRLLAHGVFKELLFDDGFYNLYDSIDKVEETYNVVLLLSVLHLVDNPQELLEKALDKTETGGLLIVEINDRLQEKKVKLPKEAVLYGKNKDNRSVYHIVKNNGGR